MAEWSKALDRFEWSALANSSVLGSKPAQVSDCPVILPGLGGYLGRPLLPPASAAEVIESDRCVCVCVCTLTTEPFDVQTKYFTRRSARTISRSSSMGKVIGQRSRSRD